MKQIFSISLLFVFLTGSIRPAWVFIDFHANRDDYTSQYCIMLDQGITQCRASCYLTNQLKVGQEENAQLAPGHQPKSPEVVMIIKNTPLPRCFPLPQLMVSFVLGFIISTISTAYFIRPKLNLHYLKLANYNA
ncbi:MAG: hypothetical protein HC819_02130 [Cyclobacteriaceae bacterium]|nr:hypothetical protein [Cyclobacteriaceae bacterium]